MATFNILGSFLYIGFPNSIDRSSAILCDSPKQVAKKKSADKLCKKLLLLKNYYKSYNQSLIEFSLNDQNLSHVVAMPTSLEWKRHIFQEYKK